MKHKVSSNIMCPFYKCEERQVLYCEGLYSGTSIHLGFSYPAALSEYRDTYCRENYNECRIAKMLFAMWEDKLDDKKGE